MGEQINAVTVIGGCDPALSNIIFDFTAERCGTEEIDMVLLPGLDEALLRTRPRSPARARELFQLREIAQAQASRSRRRGSSTCLILPYANLSPGMPGFEDWIEIARRERETVRQWGLFFRRYPTACMTLDHFCEPIDFG